MNVGQLGAEPDWPEWEPGDPVPAGFKVFDGDGESGPCEPYLVPIEHERCEVCGTEQEVVGHASTGGFDPYGVSVLRCGHRQVNW